MDEGMQKEETLTHLQVMMLDIMNMIAERMPESAPYVRLRKFSFEVKPSSLSSHREHVESISIEHTLTSIRTHTHIHFWNQRCGENQSLTSL